MLAVHALQLRDPAIASRVATIVALAYEQEARVLGVRGGAGEYPSVTASVDSERLYFGAYDGDELVGVVGLGPDDEHDQIALTLLVVHPDHQRRGVARRLVAEVLARGPGAVFSVVAGARNVAALALYGSLGFHAYRQGVMGADGIAMVKLRCRAPRAESETSRRDD